LRPRDFYLAQILRESESSHFDLVQRLLLNVETFMDLPLKVAKLILNWTMENIIENRMMTVENWMETSFHLCKQRWDPAMDWLEEQPMSKIMTMISIQEKFAEKQEKDAKKAAKGR
jgi:hypothetical protein